MFFQIITIKLHHAGIKETIADAFPWWYGSLPHQLIHLKRLDTGPLAATDPVNRDSWSAAADGLAVAWEAK